MSMTVTSKDEMLPGGLIHQLQLKLTKNLNIDKIIIDSFLEEHSKLLLLEKREWFYNLKSIE